MRVTRRTSVGSGAGLATLLAAGVAVAGGAGPSVPSELTITGGGTTSPDNDTYIEGRLKSDKPKCKRRRTVKVTGPVGVGYTYGTVATKTRRDGAWVAVGDTAGTEEGEYTARVKRRKLASGVVCKGDQAPPFELVH